MSDTPIPLISAPTSPHESSTDVLDSGTRTETRCTHTLGTECLKSVARVALAFMHHHAAGRISRHTGQVTPRTCRAQWLLHGHGHVTLASPVRHTSRLSHAVLDETDRTAQYSAAEHSTAQHSKRMGSMGGLTRFCGSALSWRESGVGLCEDFACLC